eukprot:TRINITY_DN8508_c1_g1_i1.p1 TRINITY_DN8508_c1_g1~~TRINITY_DN8508_c1_g1_i1.p1  ORF type:complete len:491 (-),score=175.50 TRINITY_DN8508_c1_g1_i1:35-1507(-)
MMVLMFIFLSISLSGISTSVEGKKPPPRVAIVGAGIGGASTGFFLSRLLPGVELTVFEMGKIGGRLATEEVDGRRYESGGSIIHSANRYMVEYLDLCGLKKKEAPQDAPFTLHRDGKVVFQEWGFSLVDKVRMVWRYGIRSLMKLENFVANLLTNFGNIYSQLDSGVGFSSVEELLNGMSPVSRKGKKSQEMVDLTRITLNDKLESLGLDKVLIEELVTVATRVNYGQMPEKLHAFVGAVGLAGVDGDLWAVEGGNVRVVQCALDMSKAKVVKGEVKEVNGSAGGYQVKYSTGSSELKVEQFDLVVIASSLTSDKSGISVLPSSQGFPGSYHTTVATIVRGEFIPHGIGYSDNSTTNTNFFLSPTNHLVSIAKLSPVDYNPAKDTNLPSVFKVFSTRPLSSTELSIMFSNIHSVNVTDWLAYPSYTVMDDLSSFQLSPGLYYTSRIEWAASAMEMSVMAAKNVANLAASFWEGEEEKSQNIENEGGRIEL